MLPVHVPHECAHVRVGEAIVQAVDGRDNLASTVRERAAAVSVCALAIGFGMRLALNGLEGVDGGVADGFPRLVCASFARNGDSRNARAFHLWCSSVFAVFAFSAIFALFLELGEPFVAVLATAVVDARLPDHAEDAAAVNASPHTFVAEVAPFIAVSRKLSSIHAVREPHQSLNGCVAQAVYHAGDRGDELNSTVWKRASTVLVCALVLSVALVLHALEDVEDGVADGLFCFVRASFARNGGTGEARTFHLWVCVCTIAFFPGV
jgi:hypothetical protein